jgi:hypothetical protein
VKLTGVVQYTNRNDSTSSRDMGPAVWVTIGPQGNKLIAGLRPGSFWPEVGQEVTITRVGFFRSLFFNPYQIFYDLQNSIPSERDRRKFDIALHVRMHGVCPPCGLSPVIHDVDSLAWHTSDCEVQS